MCKKDDALACCSTARSFGVCDGILIGLTILSIVRASEALAGELIPPTVATGTPDFTVARQFTARGDFMPASSLVLPLTPAYEILPPGYAAMDPPASKSFSAEEFRPRGHSILEKDSRFCDPDDAPMLRGTTVWQRLKDYRSRDRVRVVTLWETGGGSVSLQAGRKGDPSLQWTSRQMNRGGATRGLLDQVVSASLGGVARGLHLKPRTAGADAFARPPKSAEAAYGNGGSGSK